MRLGLTDSRYSGVVSLGLWLQKFSLDVLGDHVSTCTSHSGAKKSYDWSVEQLPDLLLTTHRVKTQQVAKSRGQWCGDIELASYLSKSVGSVSLVLDLCITYERWGSSSKAKVHVRVNRQSWKQASHQILWGRGRTKTFFFNFFVFKKLENLKYDLVRPKVPKYSLTW